jgi:hypothetical protein
MLLGGVFGVAIMAAVFAGNGGYARPALSVPAVQACGTTRDR